MFRRVTIIYAITNNLKGFIVVFLKPFSRWIENEKKKFFLIYFYLQNLFAQS